MSEPQGRPTVDLIALALFAILMTSVITAMTRVSPGEQFGALLPLAVAGILLGYMLARWEVADFLSHSIALWSGLFAAVIASTSAQTSLGEVWDTRGGVLVRLTQELIRSIFSRTAGQADQGEVLVALGMVSWLVAYCAAWIYFRRGWFWLAIAGPAVVLLTSLRLDKAEGSWQIAGFLFAAICLSARNTLGSWGRSWRRRRVPVSGGVMNRLTAITLPLVAVVVLLSLLISPLIHNVAEFRAGSTLKSTWNTVSAQVAAHLPGDGNAVPGFEAFSDEFSLGGEFPQSNVVVAEAVSAQPHYLVARRYDVFDGTNWGSDITDTFRLSGEADDISVTKVIFDAGQSVALSSAVDRDRVPVSALITISNPQDGVILTIETFASATAQVYAAMGWTRINQTFVVNDTDLASVPIDLQALVASIKGAEFAVDPKTAAVTFTDPVVQARFDAARKEKEAYPIKATIDVDGENRLILTVSGRLPNYDDVEALFTHRAATEMSDYRVTGMASAATVDQLAGAGTDYPDWITSRYLQVSSTVTDRTVDLARSIVNDAGATTPYAMAVAIQNYLRVTYPYELNPPSPPDGQDWVDFFLFDHTAGRCTQYSSAMAVMLRSLGVPVRVATGYSYEASDQPGEYIYRLSTAHAWPEVYFPEYGWIAFEPTPTQPAPDFATPAESDATQAEATPEADETLAATPEPDSEPTVTPTAEASPIPPQLAIEESSGGGSGGMMALLFGIVLIAGIAGLLALSWISKTRGMTATGSLLYRLQRVGTWFGLTPKASTTPAEYADTFARRFPGTGPAAHSISEAYYHEQFGPTAGRDDAIADAERGWSHIRHTVLSWRPWHTQRNGKK